MKNKQIVYCLFVLWCLFQHAACESTLTEAPPGCIVLDERVSAGVNVVTFYGRVGSFSLVAEQQPC